MKFICLGYIDARKFASLPEDQRHTMMDACFEYEMISESEARRRVRT